MFTRVLLCWGDIQQSFFCSFSHKSNFLAASDNLSLQVPGGHTWEPLLESGIESLEDIKGLSRMNMTGEVDVQIASLTKSCCSLPIFKMNHTIMCSSENYHSSQKAFITCLTPPCSLNSVTFANFKNTKLSIHFRLCVGSQVLIIALYNSIFSKHRQFEKPVGVFFPYFRALPMHLWELGSSVACSQLETKQSFLRSLQSACILCINTSFSFYFQSSNPL